MFSDEAIDPRRDNGQRYRADLEHGIVESADVEFRSERFLRRDKFVVSKNVIDFHDVDPISKAARVATTKHP